MTRTKILKRGQVKKAASKHKTHRYVYFFGNGKADGDGSMKALLGGKGANLAEMTRIGLPVPPGFTITTEMCTYYSLHNKSYPKELAVHVETSLSRLEELTGKRFGDKENPLLVSVRSGARDSMPGMMETILNLGLNDKTVEVLARRTGNPRWAWDSYRRFIQMYGDVVMGVQKAGKDEHDPFEEVMHELKEAVGAKQDIELSAKALKELVHRFEDLIRKRTGKDFPQDPRAQLWGAVGAVLGSWNND